MEFIDLKRQQNRIKNEITESIDTVLAHGKYIMGPEVAELESKLAKYVGTKYCISCASGTDALVMALMAKGVKNGDAIFTTPFTFFATAEAISFLGATPVFVDIDEETFNISPTKLTEAISTFNSKSLTPKGIIAVDLFGLPANYEEINKIATQNNLFVIEDAAQGFGGHIEGKKAGSLAEIATTSFFPAKPLGCYGDGGAIFTDNSDIAETLRSIRVHGKGDSKYSNIRIGLNGRLDTIQAAILLKKLNIFPDELHRRNHIAAKYNTLLNKYIKTPTVPEGYFSSWAQYTLLSKYRDSVIKFLNKNGIPTTIYYPKPLHLQEVFKFLGYTKGDFPVAEKCATEVFSIPMHPYLTDNEIEYIAKSIITEYQSQ